MDPTFGRALVVAAPSAFLPHRPHWPALLLKRLSRQATTRFSDAVALTTHSSQGQTPVIFECVFTLHYCFIRIQM